MNREYNYSELIEDYLTGNLSETQKQEFELQLQQDPDLNKEFMLQKDIISAIKEVRKSELKAMLNKVNVSSSNGFNYFPIQIAGALLVSSMLAIGVYYYFSDKDQSSSDNHELVMEDTPSISESSEINETDRSPEGPASSEQENATTQEQNEVTSESGNIADKTVAEQTEEVISDLKTPPVDENPVSEIQPIAPEINVETKKDTKHAFHYQYYEDKLFLYGEFKGSQYEILKLPVAGGNRLFMSYNGKFYKMEKSRKIKAFEPVEDPLIIEQLQRLKR